MDLRLQIVVTDECLCRWAVTNNGGVRYRIPGTWSNKEHYWTGVAYRLGVPKLIKPPQKDSNDQAELYGVRLWFVEPKNGKTFVDLLKDEIDTDQIWINVLPCMEPNLVGRIEPVDLKNMQDRALFLSPASPPHYKYIRGGITAWEDWRSPGGFKLISSMDGNEGYHTRYEFTFYTRVTLARPLDDTVPDASDFGFRVDVCRKDGNDWKVEQYPSWDAGGHPVNPSIKEIMIAGPRDLPGHGDGQNPPERP